MGDKTRKAVDDLRDSFVKFCTVAVEESESPSQAIAMVAMAVDGCFHHFMDAIVKTADAIKERVGE